MALRLDGLEATVHRFLGGGEAETLWWQMSLRAIVVFLFGLLVIRLFGRRAFGKHTALDIVLAIIIGSNLSRTLTASAPLIPTFAATVALVLCFWGFDHLAARWRTFSRLVKGDPIPLARDGKLDTRRMLRVGISPGDVEEAARSSGAQSLDEVKLAVLERDGDISVIRRSSPPGDGGAGKDS